MSLILGYILVLVSWVMRTYGALQEKKDMMDKPMIWDSDAFSIVYMMIFFAIGFVGLYMGWTYGWLHAVIMLALYFAVLPGVVGVMIRKK